MDLFVRHRRLAEKGYLVNVEIIGKDENGLGKPAYTGYVNDENGNVLENVSSCDDFKDAFIDAIEFAEKKYLAEIKALMQQLLSSKGYKFVIADDELISEKLLKLE